MTMNREIGALKQMIRTELSGIHTSAPGIIVSYDTASGLASVQPLIKMKVPDGRIIDYPIIVGVPVQWPSSADGKASLTFPLKQGDGVQLQFAERSIDDWLKGGESDDPRQYDLSDAIAIPGLWRTATAAGREYPNDVCLAYGSTSVRIQPGGNVVIDGGDLIVGGVSFLNHIHHESIGTVTGPPE